MRDILYEQELQKNISRMNRILDEYRDTDSDWSEIDTLAIGGGTFRPATVRQPELQLSSSFLLQLSAVVE